MPIPVSDLAKHATATDLWMVVNGRVYDLTTFAPNHPGGPQILHQYAGRDASKPYNAYHAADLIDSTLGAAEKKGPLDESTVTQAWLDAQKGDDGAVSTSQQRDSNERPPLAHLISLHDFEQAFATFGSQKANAYVVGASNDCLTHAANKASWQRLWFRPRILRNVSAVRTASRLFGLPLSLPLYIAPMGIAKTAGPRGECALARGAAASGIAYCVATTASYTLDEICAAAPSQPLFFQLYVDRARAKTEAVLRKLEALPNVRAIFVTVDLAVVSKREADERVRSAEAGSGRGGVDAKGGGLARSTGSFIDPALCWDDLAWIQRHTTKPLVIKGVQSVADARKALALGAAGIVVSNHGGRALDGAPSTLLVLLELRRDCPEVFERMEVLVDGGVRRGSDVLKAVCLGARAVGVGRPFQCAVMYGDEGVEAVAEILRDELETAMRLCGITDLEAVRGDLSWLNTRELEMLLPPRLGARSWGNWWRGSRL